MECLLDDRYLEQSWDKAMWLVDYSRGQAEDRLRDMEVGSFLVRPRHKEKPGDEEKPYALSVV